MPTSIASLAPRHTIIDHQKEHSKLKPPDPKENENKNRKRISLWEEISFATQKKRVTEDSPESVAAVIVKSALSLNKKSDGEHRSPPKPPQPTLALATAVDTPNPTPASATAVTTPALPRGEQPHDIREPFANTDNTLDTKQGESNSKGQTLK